MKEGSDLFKRLKPSWKNRQAGETTNSFPIAAVILEASLSSAGRLMLAWRLVPSWVIRVPPNSRILSKAAILLNWLGLVELLGG